MTKENKPTITYHYKKANDYKTYHMDGVFGGIVSNGNINFNVFTEKVVVPERITHEISSDMKLKEIKRVPEQQNEIIRELQANFIMNIETAKVVKKWLEDKISNLEAQIKD